MNVIVAFTEAERLGLLSLVGVVITASASIAAVVIGQKVRRENASQHGASQDRLDRLTDVVADTGSKVDRLGERVEAVAARVDHAHTRIDNHKPRRWFR